MRAVDEVDLEIAEGEFFAMLGPSGSGKTTCLRLIAGFEQPTAGHIEIFGETAEGVPPYRRNVNTVFQDYALFPHLNVIENVGYGLMIRGVGKAERRRVAEEALELVQLPGYGDAPARAAFGRPAPARRAGPRAGQQAARCCCSTSRWARSTSSCASRCRRNCKALQKTPRHHLRLRHP